MSETQIIDEYARFRKARAEREQQRFMENVINKQDPYEKANQAQAMREHANRVAEQAKAAEFNRNTEAITEKKKKVRELKEFAENLRGSLLGTAICNIFEQVAELDNYNEEHIMLGKKIINDLIQEQGSNNLLFNMRSKNVYLNGYVNAIEETHRIVMEANKKKMEDFKDIERDLTFELDSEISSKFIQTIQDCTPARMASIIHQRVETAVNQFVDKNADDKQKIKDIYTNVKTRIDDAKGKTNEAAYTEQYNMKGKREVNKIYESGTNLYGQMVKKISESIYKNVDQFKNAGYINENSSMNVGKVLNNTRVMYTVLEMFNTMGILDVDQEYIKKNIM